MTTTEESDDWNWRHAEYSRKDAMVMVPGHICMKCKQQTHNLQTFVLKKAQHLKLNVK